MFIIKVLELKQICVSHHAEIFVRTAVLGEIQEV